MDWKKEHDVLLYCEILICQPYKFKERTVERGIEVEQTLELKPALEEICSLEESCPVEEKESKQAKEEENKHKLEEIRRKSDGELWSDQINNYGGWSSCQT